MLENVNLSKKLFLGGEKFPMSRKCSLDFCMKCVMIFTAFTILLLELLPMPQSMAAKLRISEDMDELFGTEGTCFALTSNGTLVGWGNNSQGRIGGALPFYPYFARRVLARDVQSFSCGTYAAMYVDKNHVLWGWGADDTLLKTGKASKKVEIMQEAAQVAVGYNHALALKTDGTLWAWGHMVSGQMWSGMEGQTDRPKKIWDNVREISFIDGTAFVITEENDLFFWMEGKEPCQLMWIAHDVQAVSLGRNNSFQYLTTQGDVMELTFYAFSAWNTPRQLLAENVRALCKGGFIKEDFSLWKWQVNLPEKVCDHVITAVSPSFYITTNGVLHGEAVLPFLPPIRRSGYTVTPLLRNVFVLAWALKKVSQKMSGSCS